MLARPATRLTTVVATVMTLAALLALPRASFGQHKASGATASGPAVTSAVPIKFSHNTVADVQRLAGEPQIHIDSKGNVYYAGPIGVQYATSFFWKSEDNGDSFDLLRAFPPLQRPAPSAGSGDTDFAIGGPTTGQTADAVVWTDLVNLADVASAATFDGGNTFPMDHWNDLTSPIPGADRQWNTAIRLPGATTDRVYMFYDNIDVNGLAVLYTDDYGKTWVDGERGITSGPNPGNMVADPVNQKLYATWGDGSDVFVAHAGLDATNFVPVKVATGAGNVATLFTVVDVDTAGNIYVVWAEDSSPRGVYLSYSRDQGKTWSPKIKVNTSDLKANVFPWVVAGDPGRVWVTWYGSPVDADAPSNRGPWDVYASQSLNVLSTTTTPTWRQLKVSEHPVHDNEICLSGIGCTAGQAEDRDMLDDFTSDIDPKGMLHIAYNDTNNQIGSSSDADAGGAFVMHTRQLSGPSLYTKFGNVTPKPAKPVITSASVSGGVLTAKGTHSLPPLNWSVDPKGDAGDPRHGPGCPCPNNPVLDLSSSGLTRNSDGSLTAILRVNNLPTTPAAASAAAGNKTILYQMFFSVNGHVFFAAVEAAPVVPGIAYAGTPGFIPNQAGIAKIATYQPDPQKTVNTTFTWTPGTDGTIQIVIPAAATGGALASTAELLQVTGLVQTLQTAPGLEFFMDERDATPATEWEVYQKFLPNGSVQASIDDPSFQHPVKATLTDYPNGSHWQVKTNVSSLSTGTHTLYVRQVANGFAGPAASILFKR